MSHEHNNILATLPSFLRKPWMQVNYGKRWNVGPPRSDRAIHPWWRWFPTWSGMGVGCHRRARLAQGKGSKGGMESYGVPLMPLSGCGCRGFNEDVWAMWGYSVPGVWFSVVVDIVLDFQFLFVRNKEMAGCSPLSSEGSREGFQCSKCASGWGMSSMGKDVAENQGMGSGDNNPREKWYNMEKSSVE